MSTRTIIEVNHDYIHDLLAPEGLKQLSDALRSGFMRPDDVQRIAPGVRVLGQRHHSETLKLEIK